MGSLTNLAAVSTFAAQAELTLWEIAMVTAEQVPAAEPDLLLIINEFRRSVEQMSMEWVK